MKLFACVEKSGGMLFNGRRVSRDSAVCDRMLFLAGERKIYLNAYSAGLFEVKERLFVSDDFLSLAGEEDFCFVENTAIPVGDVEEVYLFCFHRDYPADTFFTLDLKSDFKKIKTEHFAGSSHKKITLEIYKRRDGGK